MDKIPAALHTSGCVVGCLFSVPSIPDSAGTLSLKFRPVVFRNSLQSAIGGSKNTIPGSPSFQRENVPLYFNLSRRFFDPTNPVLRGKGRRSKNFRMSPIIRNDPALAGNLIGSPQNWRGGERQGDHLRPTGRCRKLIEGQRLTGAPPSGTRGHCTIRYTAPQPTRRFSDKWTADSPMAERRSDRPLGMGRG